MHISCIKKSKSITKKYRNQYRTHLKYKVVNDKRKVFLINFISNAIFGVIQDWVNRGCIEKPNELATIMNKIITSAFK